MATVYSPHFYILKSVTQGKKIAISNPSPLVLGTISRPKSTSATMVNKDGSAKGLHVQENIPIEKRYPSFPAVLDINKIQNILPHRYPFLFVDRVVEYKPGKSAVAIKNVTINDNFFTGHFPNKPIMPGVLLLEAMAQVGGVVMLEYGVSDPSLKLVFGGIDKVRFRKAVVPGDTLVMQMNVIKYMELLRTIKMEGKAYVDGEVVCEGEFLLAIANI